MMKPMPRLGSILGRCALSMSASFECNVLFNMHRTLDTRRAARVCVCVYIYLYSDFASETDFWIIHFSCEV